MTQNDQHDLEGYRSTSRIDRYMSYMVILQRSSVYWDGLPVDVGVPFLSGDWRVQTRQHGFGWHQGTVVPSAGY